MVARVVTAKRNGVGEPPKSAVTRGGEMEKEGQERCFVLRSIVDSHARHEKVRQR